jgi:hypothetical protein
MDTENGVLEWWSNGGARNAQAEFRIQNPEFRRGTKDPGPPLATDGHPSSVAALRRVDESAQTGKRWKKGCGRAVGGRFWRKTGVLNYTHLYAFIAFYTKFLKNVNVTNRKENHGA